MAEAVSPTKPRRLLIVDSNTALVSCWRRFVAELPLEVQAVTTLAAAMDHLSQEVWCERPFDIVITDLTLADGCGQDLLPVAGTLKPRPRLGVIASRLDGGTALSIAHQCDIAIAKPLDRSALIQVLKRLSVRDAHAGVVDEFAQRSRLSRRETELLQAAVQGLNNDEIAAALGCDRSTVGTYWSRIFRKTGASSPRAVLGLIIRSYGSNTNAMRAPSRQPRSIECTPLDRSLM